MKQQWLNLVLSLTNRIHIKKQAILGKVGIGVAGDILSLIFLEVILGIISLPLYLGLKPVTVTVFLKEKGGYGEITSDYNLRRVLTLTGVIIILIIWLIKLLVITLAPTAFGPLQLYSISDLKPADVMEESIILTEAKVQTAPVLETMARPRLTEVRKAHGKDYVFYGTGQPSTLAVMFLSDQQTLIFTSPIDEKGRWEIEHSQEDFKLSEGNHSVSVVSYDEKLDVRSPVSVKQYFKVKTSLLDRLIRNLDIFINLFIIIIIALGISLMVLTI